MPSNTPQDFPSLVKQAKKSIDTISPSPDFAEILSALRMLSDAYPSLQEVNWTRTAGEMWSYSIAVQNNSFFQKWSGVIFGQSYLSDPSPVEPSSPMSP